MKTLIFVLAMLMSVAASAQERVRVEAQSYEVSDNLDLEAVAVVFGESKNTEDFEKRLNDPENKLSNLDLNNDGYVDFLRVMEMREEGEHVVLIQAVIGEDLYQDVATVVVEGESKKSATVTIVGNSSIYGDNYVIRPVFVTVPVIFDWFWLPAYAVYRSLYYWDYYPSYYYRWVCMGYHSYHRYIHRWHRHHYCCDFVRPTHYTNNFININIYNNYSRNDYVTERPNEGYRRTLTPNSNLRVANGVRGNSTPRINSGSVNRSSNGISVDRATSDSRTNPTVRGSGTSVSRGSANSVTRGNTVNSGSFTRVNRGTMNTVSRGSGNSVSRGTGHSVTHTSSSSVSRGSFNTVSRGSLTSTRTMRPQQPSVTRGNSAMTRRSKGTTVTNRTVRTSRETTYRNSGGSRTTVTQKSNTLKKADSPAVRKR